MTSWWGTLILFCVSGEQAEESKEVEDTPAEKEIENNDSENLENDEETNDLENMEDEEQEDEQNAERAIKDTCKSRLQRSFKWLREFYNIKYTFPEFISTFWKTLFQNSARIVFNLKRFYYELQIQQKKNYVKSSSGSWDISIFNFFL